MKLRADRLPLWLISSVLHEYMRHENTTTTYVNKLGLAPSIGSDLVPKKGQFTHITLHMHTQAYTQQQA